MKPGFRRGRLFTAAATIATVVVGLLVWLFWPTAPVIPGAERVRQYSNVRACMLTGADGVADATAAAAWDGLQSASGSSDAMVSYLPVPAPATKASAEPYLTSLVQRQCSVIVAVGPAQVAAASVEAGRFRHVHFIVITSRPVSPAVIRIPLAPAARVHTAVQAAVSAAVNG